MQFTNGLSYEIDMLKSKTLISVGNCRAQLNAELTHSIASCPVDLLGPDQRSKSPLQATYACVCVCVYSYHIQLQALHRATSF